MGEIHSAYRFIPVEENQEFFSPQEWASQVSIDKPFKDGLSGKITYRITANTPIFIKGEDGNFCRTEDGQYFIPGSSVKGCVRSVLEILSFGHLSQDRVLNSDEGFSFRDLADNDRSDENCYMQKMKEVYVGWLSEEGKIVSWGKPVHLKYVDFPKFGVTEVEEERFNKRLRKKELVKVLKGEFVEMNAFLKYAKYGYLSANFSQPSRLPNAPNYDRRFFVTPKGQNKGTIVFSGKMANKKSDFVLLDRDEKKDHLVISKDVLRAFKNIYQGTRDYKSIPVNREKGGRAVFFTKDGCTVKTIGLSYLHIYESKNKIHDAIPTVLRNQSCKPDLADVMFGTTELRGRIQFTAAKQDGEVELLVGENESIFNVLGSPSAKYYPTYLQDGTWDGNNPVISGIKRYPIKPHYNIAKLIIDAKNQQAFEAQNYPYYSGNVYESVRPQKDRNGKVVPFIPRDTKGKINFDTICPMNPLKKAVFKGDIYYHNLRKEELGALLSALTFHGKESECKHSLGMAKSHGYGSVSIEITEFGEDRESCLKSFEDMMVRFKKDWKDCIQLRELFAMAKGFKDESLLDVFTPMLLEQFGKAKQEYMTGRSKFSLFTDVVSENSYHMNRANRSNNYGRNDNNNNRTWNRNR